MVLCLPSVQPWHGGTQVPEDYRYNLGVGCANDDWRGVGYFSRSSVLFCLLEVGFGSGDDFISHLKHRLGLGRRGR